MLQCQEVANKRKKEEKKLKIKGQFGRRNIEKGVLEAKLQNCIKEEVICYVKCCWFIKEKQWEMILGYSSVEIIDSLDKNIFR